MVMKKTYSVVMLLAVFVGLTLLLGKTAKVAAAALAGIKNVVLVHGAFADGSGWDAVAKILEKDGYKVSVAQPPETSYADDQKYTKAAIDAMGGPVVLVGHSYGGSIITEAGNIQTLRRWSISPPLRSMKVRAVRRSKRPCRKPPRHSSRIATGWWIDQDHFVADFAADIPPAQAHFMAIAQVPISTDSFTHKVTNPAWKNKPTWYMVASEDRSINPIQERMMAKRANAKTVEVKRATWPICLTRRKQPSSSKRWPPPRTSISSQQVFTLQAGCTSARDKGGSARRRSTSKINRSEWIFTAKENNRESAY
jgi:pimeloyl-ACP methyl ester carboxylesterase